MMKKNVAAVLIFVSIITFAQSSRETKAKELIEVTGVSKMAVQGAKQFVSTFKENYKNIPDVFWDDFMKEVSSEEFSNLYIPIYAKYYTESELDELIRFYKTPIGQKVLVNTPLIMKESVEIGRDWGQKLGKKLVEKLNEQKGYQSPPPPMPSKGQ
ncbi:hypothetical protein QE422_003862 [Chryseobacterium sp. SORGH_AS 447]|uniref:DUF2059 domain-containing protein n=1 Tax=Chryseobacterium sp. SORGH_AS_0447 TaxID=3041769 RepID=UPI00277DB4FB|nr:DUF2059 domain-containing protein [Chryseobacterium sp. SORGH_AS_0447]MDQ1163494.1 hypothetical protein [Chryseobacterium sp. SORGH_AS_0447]